MSQKGADRMANSVGPDQTAPVGAVGSGSALFAQTYLTKYLEFFTFHTSISVFLRKFH